MPKYISLGRVSKALEGLRGFPPAVIAYLAMKKSGVNETALAEYGSQQEDAFLNEYFRQSGAPPRKTYYIPFGEGGWRDPGYSGKTLQRARTSKNAAGHVFANGLEHPGKKTFRFLPNVIDQLKGGFPRDRQRINVFDLIAWMRRGNVLADDVTLQNLVSELKNELHLSNTEFESLFEELAETEEAFFTNHAPDADQLVRLLEGVVQTVVLDDEAQELELLGAIETHMADDAELELPLGFVKRFYDAIKAQGFVVLVGKPGTGKTRFIMSFVNAFKNCVQSDAVIEVFEPVSPEHEATDIVGYENLEGRHVSTAFVEQFIDSTQARDKRGVFFFVLDEFNLAHPDRYLAPILPALESDQKVRLPGRGGEHLLSDTYVLATANSYLDEETRLPLSGPVLRRAQVIRMPNALDELLKGSSNVDVRFGEVLQKLARQSTKRLIDRAQQRGESFLDRRRIGALDTFLTDPSKTLDISLQRSLLEICRTLSDDSAAAVTFGVLQDMLDLILMSGPSTAVLDQAVVQKLLPQLRGKIGVVESLAALLQDGEMPESLSFCKRLLEQADPVTGQIQPLL